MNDFRMRPAPGHFTPAEINELVDGPSEPVAPQGGPLSRLLAGLGLDDKLPIIKPIPRINTMPIAVSIPVSATTPTDSICPTCRIFEIEAETTMCPRCNRRHGIREVKADERRQHFDSVDREVLERAERQVIADARMIQAANELRELRDAIEAWDPDWRDHYGTIESAEANFLRATERQS